MRVTNPIFSPLADHLSVPLAVDDEEGFPLAWGKCLGADLVLLAPVEGLRAEVHRGRVARAGTGDCAFATQLDPRHSEDVSDGGKKRKGYDDNLTQ